jgi:hypothetical protein
MKNSYFNSSKNIPLKFIHGITIFYRKYMSTHFYIHTHTYTKHLVVLKNHMKTNEYKDK